jgi:hypothetical protein
VASSPAITGWANVSHGGVLKCRGTWHKAARCLTPARVDPKRPRLSGHGDRSE